MAIITAADFAVHYPHLAGTANNPDFQTVIDQADGLLALYCLFPVPDVGPRTLGSATYTLYPTAPHSLQPRRMVLAIRPIVSVTSVHVDLNEAYTIDTEVQPSERVLDGQRGEVWLKPTASRPWALDQGRANRVIVVAGFATTPPDLKVIAISATRHLWDRRRTQGVASQQNNAGSQQYTDVGSLLPQSVRDALGPYVLWGSDAS